MHWSWGSGGGRDEGEEGPDPATRGSREVDEDLDREDATRVQGAMNRPCRGFSLGPQSRRAASRGALGTGETPGCCGFGRTHVAQAGYVVPRRISPRPPSLWREPLSRPLGWERQPRGRLSTTPHELRSRGRRLSCLQPENNQCHRCGTVLGSQDQPPLMTVACVTFSWPLCLAKEHREFKNTSPFLFSPRNLRKESVHPYYNLCVGEASWTCILTESITQHGYGGTMTQIYVHF